MRSLLFHCKEFKANITGLSTRGVAVSPEEINQTEYNAHSCIVAFITVEEGDSIKSIVPKIQKEIEKFSTETNEKTIVLAPFAHLSNNLASFKDGILFFDILEKALRENIALNIHRVHFGSDKDLLIHLFGHPGNARYREF
jgi:hypothetical protein